MVFTIFLISMAAAYIRTCTQVLSVAHIYIDYYSYMLCSTPRPTELAASIVITEKAQGLSGRQLQSFCKSKRFVHSSTYLDLLKKTRKQQQ